MIIKTLDLQSSLKDHEEIQEVGQEQVDSSYLKMPNIQKKKIDNIYDKREVYIFFRGILFIPWVLPSMDI